MPQGDEGKPTGDGRRETTHAASEFIAFAAKVKHKTTSLSYVDSAVCLCVCVSGFLWAVGGVVKPKQCFCARVAKCSQAERINNVN